MERGKMERTGGLAGPHVKLEDKWGAEIRCRGKGNNHGLFLCGKLIDTIRWKAVFAAPRQETV